MANGKPEAVPFYPHEFTRRQSSMGLTDPSAMVNPDPLRQGLAC
jgi:ATP-dependent DNA helicase RecG